MVRLCLQSERGSATVWSIALMSLLVSVAMFGFTLAQAALARQRVATSADLAALAAASTWLEPCQRARAVAESNRTALITCEVSASGTAVEVGMPAPNLVERLLRWLGKEPAGFIGRARAG